MLQSFFSGAIAPYTFLRESPLTLSVRGSAVVADADLSTANSSPESPLHSKGRTDSLMLAQLTASTVPFELDQPGGISSCPLATRIEQPGEFVSEVSLLFVCQGMIVFSSYAEHAAAMARHSA